MAFQDLYTGSQEFSYLNPTFKLETNKSLVEQIFEQGLQAQTNAFLQQNQKIRSHATEIEQVVELLGDEASKMEYCQEIAFHTLKYIAKDYAVPLSSFSEQRFKMYHANLSALLNQPNFPKFNVHKTEIQGLGNMICDTFLVGQYRYRNLLNVTQGDVFIDAGACFGDSALWAYQNGAAQVYCFEPGEHNIKYLKINLEKNNRDASLIQPYALGEENTTLTFFSGIGLGGSSHIAQDDDYAMVNRGIDYGNDASQSYLQKVQCVRIDDWCTEHKVEPTFIKMDIEGAELSALKGGAETIKRLKPKLAICLYHKTEDMWEIPLYIHSIVPEYKLYCKKSNIINEFILFAVP